MNDIYQDGREVQHQSADAGLVSMISKAEIDQQIATAHKYPRSISQFRKTVTEMVSISESVAEECIYSLPRDGKTIIGPSARFAEVVASAWGNSRAGARVVNESGEFITAQGVFHDLERNVAITYEVQRRITNKRGQKFGADMVGVTANAACSIALRNAILKGVPKAFWSEMYERAQEVVRGDFETLPNRRAKAFAKLTTFGVTKEQAFATLGVTGESDIGLDQLLTLKGLITALKEGDTTIEQAFGGADQKAEGFRKPEAKSAKASATIESQPAAAASAQIDTAEDQSAKQESEQIAKRTLEGDSPELTVRPGMLSLIRKKAEQAGIAESEICAHHKIKKLEDSTTSQGAEILDFIKAATK